MPKGKHQQVGHLEETKKSKSSSSVNDQFLAGTIAIKSIIERQLPFFTDSSVHNLLVVKHFEDQNKCSQFLRYDQDTVKEENMNMC